MNTDTIGLIVLVIAVAVVMIAGKIKGKNEMSAHINFHNGHDLRAYSHRVSGSLGIKIDSKDHIVPDSVTIFTEDQTLADRLVDAINSIVKARKEELAEAEAARHREEVSA